MGSQRRHRKTKNLCPTAQSLLVSEETRLVQKGGSTVLGGMVGPSPTQGRRRQVRVVPPTRRCPGCPVTEVHPLDGGSLVRVSLYLREPFPSKGTPRSREVLVQFTRSRGIHMSVTGIYVVVQLVCTRLLLESTFCTHSSSRRLSDSTVNNRNKQGLTTVLKTQGQS